MALTGRGCGHELRPGVRFCTICEAPHQASLRPPSVPPGRPRRLRTLLLGLVTFLAAGAIAAAVMLIAHPLQRGPAPAPASSMPPGGTASSSAALTAQEQAARGLAGLLAQSVHLPVESALTRIAAPGAQARPSQTMAASWPIVSMPYCPVGFPVVSTAIR